MKKLGLVFLALVIALGSLGAAYAMWKDSVEVTSTVNTGNVCIKITQQRVADNTGPFTQYVPNFTGEGHGYLNPPYDLTCNDAFAWNSDLQKYFWDLDKNVSWGQCDIRENGKLMFVELFDTYPSNFNEVGFYITNCGTIPVKIWKVEVLNAAGVKIGEITSAGSQWQFDFDGGGNDVEIQYGDNFNAQIEPGMGAPEFSFWIHTLQTATQNGDFQFGLRVIAANYNDPVFP